MGKHYRVIARNFIDGDLVTTNDKEYAKQLIDAGGKILCHPDLFLQQWKEDPTPLVIGPYVVHVQPGILAQFQDVPKETAESYEVRMY